MQFRTNYSKQVLSAEPVDYSPQFDEAVPDDSLSVKDIVAFYTRHGELPMSNASAFYTVADDGSIDFDDEVFTRSEFFAKDLTEQDEIVMRKALGDVEKYKAANSAVSTVRAMGTASGSSGTDAEPKASSDASAQKE